MTTLQMAIDDFLAQRRIAVAGVSATRELTGNVVYRRFKERGYEVFAVNPHAQVAEGDPCYPDLASIPGSVDGVVIVTRPAIAEAIVRQCPGAGVPRVWMHRSLAHGSSVSEEAVAYCREHGVAVIAGACPLMFGKTADFGHRCMRVLLGLTGGRPTAITGQVPARA